jgi:hypothetical protein
VPRAQLARRVGGAAGAPRRWRSSRSGMISACRPEILGPQQLAERISGAPYPKGSSDPERRRARHDERLRQSRVAKSPWSVPHQTFIPPTSKYAGYFRRIEVLRVERLVSRGPPARRCPSIPSRPRPPVLSRLAAAGRRGDRPGIHRSRALPGVGSPAFCAWLPGPGRWAAGAPRAGEHVAETGIDRSGPGATPHLVMMP